MVCSPATCDPDASFRLGANCTLESVRGVSSGHGARCCQVSEPPPAAVVVVPRALRREPWKPCSHPNNPRRKRKVAFSFFSRRAASPQRATEQLTGWLEQDFQACHGALILLLLYTVRLCLVRRCVEEKRASRANSEPTGKARPLVSGQIGRGGLLHAHSSTAYRAAAEPVSAAVTALPPC